MNEKSDIQDEVLKAEGLVRKFDSRVVVRGVDLHVKRGEIVGLLGPNGAGKTTSFYMIVGLLRPSSGKIFLNDVEINKLLIHKRARLGIGYLPQNSSVFRKLSVEDNLLAVMEVWGIPRRKRKERLEQLLEQFGIGHIRKSPAVALSGGERRRLEIARTLIIEPRFILLDEPFAGIDPVTVDEIQGLVTRLVNEENLGVLITDHNVRETLGLCDRAYILADGKILTEGSPDHIIEQDIVKRVYLGENFSF